MSLWMRSPLERALGHAHLMKPGHGISLDRDLAVVEASPAGDSMSSRQAPGLSDELGERLLISENGAPAFEILRFRQAFTAMPGFEVALRRRVERLRHIKHPAFTRVRGVDYVRGGLGLVLLSSWPAGRRLSELLPHASDPALAADLIRQLTPALAELHEHGEGIGHGALTPSRIVVTPEGQLVIVEHVLGSALERLQLTATSLFTELGITAPPTGSSARPRFDNKVDYYQLGCVALSLLLGRPLSSGEYPHNLSTLVDELILKDSLQPAPPVDGLRVWLERALQLRGRIFASSKDALDALVELPDLGAERSSRQWKRLLEHRGPSEPVSSVPTFINDRGGTEDPVADPFSDDPVSVESLDQSPAPEQLRLEAAAVSSSLIPADAPTPDLSLARQAALPATDAAARLTAWTDGLIGKPNDHLRTLVIALAVCAVVEGLVIAGLLQRRWTAAPVSAITEVKVETEDPGATVLVDGQSVGTTPLQVALSAGMRSLSVVGPPRQPLPPELAVGSTGQEASAPEPRRNTPVRSAAEPDTGRTAAPAPQRSGGIRVVSPIELEVYEGDRRLGSSAVGIVSAPAGSHELDLVNSVLGFRTRQSVEVKGGQVVSLAVSPPEGRININAVPWAEVLIDGKVVGETPIGNLSIPLGDHEVVFRHPQLGEQRQKVVVRLDGVTRVSANLQR